MSSQDGKETIALAMKRLQKGVTRIVQKRAVDQRTHTRLQTLIRHTHHLLTQLLEKRDALRALLEWFRLEWKRLESKLPQHALEILPHALQLFVRCQDGMVLMTSGECRHPKDIAQAKTTHFCSKLSTLQARNDGYTCLYKADAVYSGFGWDEFANETVGIQARMIQLLKPHLKAPWDSLERQGATPLLETLLDQQELAVKNLQHELQSLKQQMLQDITQRLRPTKLTFATQDKMERLVVSVPSQTIRLERRADKFQIAGSSVLPNDYRRTNDWESYALQLKNETAGRGESTSTSNRKRRLAIEESESEEEEDSAQIAKPKPTRTKPPSETPVEKACGLMVRIETSKPKTETEDSLTAIKTQMGVDVQGLETSREEFEQETKGGQADYSSYEEDKVKRLSKILQRAQSRSHVDENEVWDARECLRQAYMEWGNECLWSNTQKSEQALGSFQQAKRLVSEQQKSHQRSVESSNDATSESRNIQRNLIFLLVQATVNCGIALVEGSQSEKKTNRKKLNQAIPEFRQVRKLAEEMREYAKADQQKCRVHSMDWIQTLADIMEADKLESLACRWMGLAFWSLNQEKQAIEVLDQASSLFRGTNAACRSQLLPNLLEVAAECIHATSTLADLACSAMERLNRSAREKGDSLLDVVTGALERQAEIVRGLATSSESGLLATAQAFQQENDFASSKSILDNLEEIRQWWESMKNQPTGFGMKTAIPRRLPRSVLFPEGDPRGGPFAEPTAHILISEGSRRRKKTQSQATSSSVRARNNTLGDSQRGAIHALLQVNVRRPKKFRKWGDELLPQEPVDPNFPSGATRAKLAYPSVAPIMPPEILLIFNAQSSA
jgi:hypothetical protein